MQNLVTKMSGGLAVSQEKFEDAAKSTKTRANVNIVYALSESWGINTTLFLPVVQLRDPDYAEIVSARDETGRMIGPTNFTVQEFEKDNTSGLWSLKILKTTATAMDTGSIISVRVVAK